MLKNQNTKDALIISCYICALGAFGAFFRWLQMQIARDSETGLMNPNLLNIIVPLIIIAAFVLLLVRSKNLAHDGKVFPTEMFEALHALSIVYYIASWLIAALMVIGGVMTVVNSTLDAQRGLYTLIAALAVCSGLSFPLICSAARRRFSPGLVSVFMTLPVIMFCLWLIACYRANANNPNVWNYAIEIIAICAVILALFHVSGYAFGRSTPKRTAFLCQFAAFMCITTLADSRYMGLELILVGTAGMLLLENWILVKNRCLPKDEPPQEQKKSEPEKVSEQDVVIPAGESESVPEPTLEAPTRKSKAPEKKPDVIDRILDEYKSNM